MINMKHTFKMKTLDIENENMDITKYNDMKPNRKCKIRSLMVQYTIILVNEVKEQYRDFSASHLYWY